MGRSGIAVLAVATAFAVVPSAHAATASFTVSPDPAPTGTQVIFDASDSQGVHFLWDLDGDGGTETDTGPGKVTSKVYDVAGIYTVKLVVVDAQGQSDEATQTFNVIGKVEPEPEQEDVTAPVISGFQMSPRAFRVGKTHTPKDGAIAKVKGPVGTKLSWSLSEPARVQFTIQQCTPKSKKCSVHIKARFRRDAPAGARSLKYSGLGEDFPLPKGTYRISMLATDAARNESYFSRLFFTVLPRR